MRRLSRIVILGLLALALPVAAAKHLTGEIKLDHGVSKVEGRDSGGHKINIEVDAHSGEIVKIKRH
jgi:hypothetical protein